MVGSSAPPPAGPEAERRIGPPPAPPPERIDTWTVLDLLATTQRWRGSDRFIAGQADGLARALVGCLSAGGPVPRWLRRTLLAFLLEALWERPGPRQDPDAAVLDLLRRWREPGRGHEALR